MESKFFGSSPIVGSTKRGLTNDREEEQSPAAKRAKRVKHAKKRRAKNERDSEDYVEQQDWVYFDTSPATGSPIVQKQSPAKPPTPFPLKLAAHQFQAQKSAGKAHGGAELDVVQKEETKIKHTLSDGGKHSPTHDATKTAANTRKIRAERDFKSKTKHAVNNGSAKISAVAGPSKPAIQHQRAAEEFPMDLSSPAGITPPIDYTFKAFPNPRISPPLTSKKSNPDAPQVTIHNTDSTSEPAEAVQPLASPTLPAGAAPAGTKTLKAINKHLKALEAKLTAAGCANHNDSTEQNKNDSMEIRSLRNDLTRLQSRLERDELRAAVRHEVLFNSLVKVSSDVAALGRLVQAHEQQPQQENNDEKVQGAGNSHSITEAAAADAEHLGGCATPRAKKTKDNAMHNGGGSGKRKAGMEQSRKTLEQCLRIYTEDLNRASSAEDVSKYGGLCVQYARDLFKTLG